MTDCREIFITGIDTDAGKSYATAWYAARLAAAGRKVITQKFIQTGNDTFSEDIELHRRLAGARWSDADHRRLTAPIIFSYPASAQLAARIDGVDHIDLSIVDRARRELLETYDTVLVEGAGGLMVPVTDEEFTIDYVTSRRLPVILVTNSRLGSINHTVLSLEAIRNRNIPLLAVIYNHHFDTAEEIAADSRRFVGQYVARIFPDAEVLDMPSLNLPPMPQPTLTISKAEMAGMTPVTFDGDVCLIDTPEKADQALDTLEQCRIVGFDTETRPTFRKGDLHPVALMQIATENCSFLFRLNRIGMLPRVKRFLENPDILKIGLSLKDDFNSLRRLAPLSPGGFVELQRLANDYDIRDGSLQKIYAIIFGQRISKGQRLTNWEADALTPAQCQYASIDAWACLRIYNHLTAGLFEPAPAL
ncbi:MAG: dethiobiotin synthase [Clostridium sp.]|nr:dethiobiotin synthase [Clostridium sp.]